MGLFDKRKKQKQSETLYINCPITGVVNDVSTCKDDVFRLEMLGKGVVIEPLEEVVCAPVNGEIVSLFPTKHAIGLKSRDGVEVLIHIGIDTVELNGTHFTAFKQQGDHVIQGEPLVSFDRKALKEAGYDTSVMMVITNTTSYGTIKSLTGEKKMNDSTIEIEV